ncbi:MAG: transcription antitermination factor NusB [Desulfobacter sp.]|nr:transcription antitermination factor NusB [Desulfobacter sp.]WDP85719.1 MAG: transcription antitermination factor NusB [Desulfobacter sp.]
MGERRKARELVLQALFFLDVNETDPEQGIQEFCIQNEDAFTPEITSFFHELVNGVLEEKKKIDLLLDKWAKHWKISRMPVVDRNIMRIAVFELIRRPDIPATVSINEAVEIGKKFGTRDSGPFINGVLDRIRVQENLE